MRWDVNTLFSAIAPGTSFCVTESPQIAGGPYAEPVAGDAFKIELGGGGYLSGNVVSATSNEIILEIGPDRWRLTPVGQNDQPVRINTPGMHSTYWVARAKI